MCTTTATVPPEKEKKYRQGNLQGLSRAEMENQTLTDFAWVAGCLGAVAHSIGQMAVAVPISGTPMILIYLPAMIVCSIITGLFTGCSAGFLVKRSKKLWKTFFK